MGIVLPLFSAVHTVVPSSFWLSSERTVSDYLRIAFFVLTSSCSFKKNDMHLVLWFSREKKTVNFMHALIHTSIN